MHADMTHDSHSGSSENRCLLPRRITLHKKDALPKHLEGLEFPLIENANEYVVHGLQWPDYLRELDNPQVRFSSDGMRHDYNLSNLHCFPQAEIFKTPNLTQAMTNTYRFARDFMVKAFDLTEDQVTHVIMKNMLDEPCSIDDSSS